MRSTGHSKCCVRAETVGSSENVDSMTHQGVDTLPITAPSAAPTTDALPESMSLPLNERMVSCTRSKPTGWPFFVAMRVQHGRVTAKTAKTKMPGRSFRNKKKEWQYRCAKRWKRAKGQLSILLRGVSQNVYHCLNSKSRLDASKTGNGAQITLGGIHLIML